MVRGVAHVARLARALFAPRADHTLTASRPARTGVRGMVRRLVTFLFIVLLLSAAGYGGYRQLFTEPRPPEVAPPPFDDTGSPLLSDAEFAELAKADAVAMLDQCVSRYSREVKGFRATLHKRERIGGVLHPKADDPLERVKVSVRSEPYAVRMVWETRGRKDMVGATPAGLLYPNIDAKNPEKTDAAKMAVWRPDAWTEGGKYKDVDVKGDLARTAARYTVTESGFDKSMLRTRDAWRAARERGDAAPTYLGCEPVEKLGGRVCHVIRRMCPETEVDSFARTEARPPRASNEKKYQNDGFDQVTIYVDAAYRIQIGTELKKANGDLIGEYYFRDLELNPEFPADTFTPGAIKIPLPTK